MVYNPQGRLEKLLWLKTNGRELYNFVPDVYKSKQTREGGEQEPIWINRSLLTIGDIIL